MPECGLDFQLARPNPLAAEAAAAALAAVPAAAVDLVDSTFFMPPCIFLHGGFFYLFPENSCFLILVKFPGINLNQTHISVDC
jgi:hypothetical protein